MGVAEMSYIMVVTFTLVLLSSTLLGSASGASSPDCCRFKEVGGVKYSLAGIQDTSAYNCLSPCVYMLADDINRSEKYCFAAGDLEVVCGEMANNTDDSGLGGATKKVVPWFLGMEPLEFCVETGTEVVFNKTGHNVVPMATQADYDACTGFLGDNPLVGNNVDPWIEKMDSDGIYYFACGVGTHCSAGGMKAKITVAPSCAKNVTVPWSWGMEPQVLCVETGTTVIIEKTGSFHNVNM